MARPCEGVQRRMLLMSSFLFLQQWLACLVRLIWMVLEIEGGDRKAAALWDAASRMCSLQLTAFFCNWYQVFSLSTSSASTWCIHIVDWTRLLPGKSCVLFYRVLIMAATVSLGRPEARSICLIFPLCIETNGLEKSTNTSVAWRFFLWYLLWFNGSETFVM